MRPNTGKTNKDYSKTYRLKNPAYTLYRYAKHRASKKDIEFSIDVEDIVLPTHCPILGICLTMNSGVHGGQDNSYSLDRIDSSKGYIKGNVQVISYLANSMKRNANKQQLIMFARWILENYDENFSDT
jgi:hypothetical protein